MFVLENNISVSANDWLKFAHKSLYSLNASYQNTLLLSSKNILNDNVFPLIFPQYIMYWCDDENLAEFIK